MDGQTLSDIIRGMQHAVNTAEDMLAAHYLERLERCFKPDGTPLMRSVKLPDGKVVDIPIVLISQSSSLSIKEIELEFSIRIQSVTKKESTEGGQRSCFNVYFSGTENSGFLGHHRKNNDVIRIKMKFEERDEPEAVARVRERLCSFVE